MSTSTQLHTIRNKKLGLLILDARRASRRSVEECAGALQISAEEFRAFESGQRAPSLPQIELLALYLNIPVEHFWGRRALSESAPGDAFQEKERLLQLRDRVIGANIRLGRTRAGLSLAEMAERTGIAEATLQQYEFGTQSVPMPELDSIAAALDVPVEQYYDHHGPIGRWRSQQGSMQKFLDLPPEIQQFVAKPVNRPYLELAMRLSDLSAEKLRAVAEVLLEITY